MNNTGCVLRGILTITLFTSTAFGQAPLTARAVINTMASQYAVSFTYSDEGQATYAGRIWSFKTLFDRPTSKFKFEFTISGRNVHDVLWRTAPGDVRIWSTVTGQVELKPMNMAAPWSVIAGGSGWVIRLLMPEEGGGFSLSSNNWVDSALPEEEMVDGHACYKISGHYPQPPDDTLSVWIDKETFLLRKFVDTRGHTITYNSPQVNVAIDAASFDFQPPAANPTR
jgi:hypothetical protein